MKQSSLVHHTIGSLVVAKEDDVSQYSRCRVLDDGDNDVVLVKCIDTGLEFSSLQRLVIPLLPTYTEQPQLAYNVQLNPKMSGFIDVGRDVILKIKEIDPDGTVFVEVYALLD
jgi:hypothetical protein